MSDRHHQQHTGRSFPGDVSAFGGRFAAATGARQRTLKGPVHCSGVGLHTGDAVSISLFPAPIDHGIVFRRLDVADRDPQVSALWHKVVQTNHCTVIGNEDGVTVSTIEHLMAALAGAAIDNVVIAIDGPEVPIMDGSAAPFVFLIECAGTVEQDAPRRAIRVKRPVMVSDGGKIAALSPSDGFSVSFEIDFGNTAVARQECFFNVGDGTFKADISRARTFGFLHEVDGLRAAGLALGGSLDNAVVVAGDRILNEDGLRYDNEFVRHKVLDCIGDLYLAGGPLLGHFHGVRSGHAFNNRLLQALFADRDAWELVDMPASGRAERPMMRSFGAEPLAVSA